MIASGMSLPSGPVLPMTLPSDRNKQAKRLLADLYEDLRRHGTSNRLDEARAYLAEDIAPEWQAPLANILTHHCFQTQNYSGALAYCKIWVESAPDNITAINALLSVLTRLRRWDEVIRTAKEQQARHRDDFHLLGSLCRALAAQGQLDEARAHGTHCLVLKDRSANGNALDLSEVAVPAFNPGNRDRNVIAFSLFGSKERYIRSAVENARASRFIYPEWSCRFYIDASVPKNITTILAQEGAKLINVEGLPAVKYGTFWRFLVADDPEVDRYLIRDCDAVVNVRERLAVEEWIESRRHFHVMRDFYSHTELVLAGMWGGVARSLPPMGKTFVSYVEQTIQHRTLDQEFLRESMWPTIRQSVLVHDSQFAFGERRDYPRLGQMPPGWHVGMSHLP